ncbi:helix-turn-helix transcriptional regulator (plasmid) [Deinococcus sp. VB142]|uniref:Helix-turn-helix transcriptional regulator n=1 Tax=Deinococcus sp. VB142 TaxID=3112952 RepID=A0AAU6Q8Q2_9DEIO
MTREELSELLRSQMEERGWKILDLAKASGVSYEVVRRAVRGEASSSVENTTKILVAVGFTLQPQALPVPNPQPDAEAQAVAG